MNSLIKNSVFLLSIAVATPFAFSSESGQEKDPDKSLALNVKEISAEPLMPAPAAAQSRTLPDYPALEKMAHDKMVDELKCNHPLPNQQKYTAQHYDQSIMAKDMRRRAACPNLPLLYPITVETVSSSPMVHPVMPKKSMLEKGNEKGTPYSP